MVEHERGSIKDWLKVLVLLSDEAAAVALVFLILWFLGIEIPLPIIIIVALLLGVFVFITHKSIIPTFHKKQVTGAEGLVGREAEVIEPLAPFGVIKIDGEYWKAKAVEDDIAKGAHVEILASHGLTLEVKRTSQ